MLIDMHIQAHAYRYVFICTHTCVHDANACTHMNIYSYIQTLLFHCAHIHIHIIIFIHEHICRYVHTHSFSKVHIYTCTHLPFLHIMKSLFMLSPKFTFILFIIYLYMTLPSGVIFLFSKHSLSKHRMLSVSD